MILGILVNISDDSSPPNLQFASDATEKGSERKKSDHWSSPQQRHIVKQSSKQRDIPIILTKSDSVSKRDVSSETDEEKEARG